MWKREEEKEAEPEGKRSHFPLQSKFVFCPQVCCVKMERMSPCPCCPVLAAQHRSTARTASHSTEDISLAFSSLVLSLSSPSHAHTKHITLSRSPSHYATVACLYLLCKVRCKVLHCLSFLLGKALWTRDTFIGLQNLRFVYLIFVLHYLALQLYFHISDICSSK